MSQYDIKGGNAIIETDVLGDMLPLVCVKTFSVNVIAKVKEITTDGNGLWEDWDYDRLGFTITISGLTQILGEDSKPTFYDLYDAMLNFLEVGIRLLYVDNSGNPAITTCTVLINNKLFDANPIKLLNSSVTMLGKGELITHKPNETNTITFRIEGVPFTSANQLTAITDCYKVSDSVIMSTSNAASQQDLQVSFRLPKRGGTNYGDDYVGFTVVGLVNTSSTVVDAAPWWNITYIFDYVVATPNKSLNVIQEP